MREHIGFRLRRLREERGISRRELAKLLGCTVGNVGHIETGNQSLSLSQLATVAGRLGVSVDALMAGAELG